MMGSVDVGCGAAVAAELSLEGWTLSDGDHATSGTACLARHGRDFPRAGGSCALELDAAHLRPATLEAVPDQTTSLTMRQEVVHLL